VEKKERKEQLADLALTGGMIEATDAMQSAREKCKVAEVARTAEAAAQRQRD